MPARRPEDCDALFGDHVNAGDLEALLALYEPTCGYVNGDGSVVVQDGTWRFVADDPFGRGRADV